MAERCKAKSKRSGERCKRPPCIGADVCHIHGGKAPQVRAAAKRRVDTEAARRAAVTYGVPIDIDPAEGLLDEVARTYGHVRYLLDRVQELEPDALVWGVTEESEKHATEFPGVDLTRAAKPNAWLQAYRDERAHFLKVCTETLKAGVAERQVRLAEQQGQLIAQVIRGVLEDLGVDSAEAPAVIRRHLQLVAG